VPYTGANAAVNLGSQTFTTTGQTSLGNASTTSFTSTGATYLATLGGNVGIGTTAPGAKLDVSGGLISSSTPVLLLGSPRDYSAHDNSGLGIVGYASNGTLGSHDFGSIFMNADPTILSGGASIVSMYSGGDSSAQAIHSQFLSATNPGGGNGVETLSLLTEGTSRLYINNLGNVGIGTTTPNAKLQVFGVGSGTSVSSSGATDATMNGRFCRGAVCTDLGILDSGTAYLQNRNFGDFSTNYNFILQPNGGNVGIGTVSPSSKLEVGGNTLVDGNLTLGTTTTTGTRATIYGLTNIIGDTNLAWYSSMVSLEDTYTGEKYSFGNRGSYFSFSSETIPHNAVRMTIQAVSGNVGVGTTNAKARLQSSGIPASAGAVLGSSTNAGFMVTTADETYGMLMGNDWSGNGWIQSQRVDDGATTYGLNLQPVGGSVGIGLVANNISDSSFIYKGAGVNQPTNLDVGKSIHINNTNNSNGAAGGGLFIGNETVGGTGKGGHFYFNGVDNNVEISGLTQGVGYSNILLASGGGNVGIGTNAPLSKLDISGKLKLFDTTPTNAAATTKMGYLFNNNSPAGSIIETVGTEDILSYAINVPQIGTRDTSKVGGIFRLDTRATEQAFVIYAQPTGGSVDTERIRINLQNGTTALAENGGNVGIGTTAPNSLLSIGSGTLAGGDFQIATGGKVADYGGVATTGYGVPAIYGSDRKTGLTAAQALATFTVGGADGSFEVSANVNVTSSTLHSFNVICTYTDETNTSRVLNLSFSNLAGTFLQTITNALGAGAYEGIPLHIRAKAGTTIIISSTGTFTTLVYNFEECIKQIS
jgi:hypothetical protein